MSKYTLTLTQVSEMLGLHKGNVQAYKKQGKFEAGNYNDYQSDSILRYMEWQIAEAEKHLLYLRSQRVALLEDIAAHDYKEAQEAHKWIAHDNFETDCVDYYKRQLTPRQNELLDGLLQVEKEKVSV